MQTQFSIVEWSFLIYQSDLGIVGFVFLVKLLLWDFLNLQFCGYSLGRFFFASELKFIVLTKIMIGVIFFLQNGYACSLGANRHLTRINLTFSLFRVEISDHAGLKNVGYDSRFEFCCSPTSDQWSIVCI